MICAYSIKDTTEIRSSKSWCSITLTGRDWNERLCLDFGNCQEMLEVVEVLKKLLPNAKYKDMSEPD